MSKMKRNHKFKTGLLLFLVVVSIWLVIALPLAQVFADSPQPELPPRPVPPPQPPALLEQEREPRGFEKPDRFELLPAPTPTPTPGF